MRYLVSVRVTRHGKFRKTHIAEINATSAEEALQHLENRCKPGREYARKFPGATFSQFELVQGDGAVQSAREARLREYYLFPYRAGIAPPASASLLGSLSTGI